MNSENLIKFSIIIPNYNYGRYVGEAIESALNQDWENKEVIVVDDGSEDNSVDVIKNFGKKIKALFQKNSGQREANNRGFLESSGDVIIFLDSDDVLVPGALHKIAAVWKEGLSKVQGMMLRTDASGKSMNVIVPRLTYVPAPQAIRQWMDATFEYPTPPGSGNAWSRKFLEQIFPLDDNCDSSTDSSCIALAPYWGDVVTIQDTVVLYRTHGANDSNIASRDTNYSREIRRGLTRFFTVQRYCRKNNLTLPDRKILFRGSSLLQYRVASLRLTPSVHPLADDNRIRALADAVMILFWPNFRSFRVRLAIAAWSVVTLVVPVSVARKLILKRYG